MITTHVSQDDHDLILALRDDSQVVDIRATKFYAESPLIRIIIETVQCTEVGTI